jgi:cytochrome b
MHNTPQQITIWDPFVRAFHWSLAVSYLLAWVTAEDWPGPHEQLGYFVLVLLGLRLVWGLIGTRYARFDSFVRGPSAALGYLRSLAQGHPKDYLGHNPAGGWMVIGLIVALLATASTGILANDGGELWKELHEGLANISLLLIAVHVVGVLASSVLHGENLIRAMLTGKKTRSATDV